MSLAGLIMASPGDRLELVGHELPPGESDTDPISTVNSVCSTDTVNDTSLSVNTQSPQTATTPPTHDEVNSISVKIVQDPVVEYHAPSSKVTARDTDVNDNNPRVVIVTGDLPSVESVGRRHALKSKDIRLLIVFAVISVVVFFPTGIAAVYYARKTKLMFTEDRLNSAQNGLKEVVKMCRRAERFIVLSFVAAVFVIILVFVILEHQNSKGEGVYAHGAVGVHGRTAS